MSALFTILAILALVASVLITLIVLLQNSKGGGLASNFTAGNQTFGVRQTTDILEKITWGLAIFILVVSIAASFSYKSGKGNDLTERASKDVKQTETTVEEGSVIDPSVTELEVETPSAEQTETPAI
jgi:preprotein translocase subunit SecG